MLKLPSKLRRLTRAEATRLNVSYSSKRRVDASLKKITKSTKLYTDRQVAEAKLGKKKETYTAYRISKPNKHGVVTYRDVKPSEHYRLSKRVGNQLCQIVAFGPFNKVKRHGGSQLESLNSGSEGKAVASFGFDGNELRVNLDALYSDKGFLGFNKENPPKAVNVIVYQSKKVTF